MTKYIYTFIFLTISILTFAKPNVIKDGKNYYLSDQIVIKYKNELNILNKSAEQLFNKLNILETKPVFSERDILSKASQDLQNIYNVKFSSPYNPIYIAKEITKLENIEWAEPYYLYQTSYIPNDPIYNNSDLPKYEHLKVINAEEAWDINKGSEEIIIAIVDTGVDWDHPDLEANIWINNSEIEDNSIDDDNNDFIDDIRGWDFGGDAGEPDNDPSEDAPDHGTHVAGLASAVTDNRVGIAAIGFNCKIMAIKTSRFDVRDENDNALIYSGYEGIVYAADNGAKVINCSWGGYSYSHFSQSVIDYAVSKGALVVAAAGNDGSPDWHYPSSYEGVLSVGATNNNDTKAFFSNFGSKIDVASPGVDIYSTWQTSSLYATLTGTSMASPIVAGLAGLVTNQFPNFTPLQIAEQIRANTDNIDNLNGSFTNKLGSGRINALKALTNTSSKSARLNNVTITEIGDGDGIYESGETLKFILEITNYLNPLSNLQVSLSSSNSNIELVNSSVVFGSLSTLENKSNNNELFEIFISPNVQDNLDINLFVTFTDGEYLDYEWIPLSINPTYEIHTTENLSLTFNSNGSIGFDDYPDNQKGIGLVFNNGPNLMFEGALVYGTSSSTIVNSARNDDGDKDEDFTNIIPIILNSPGDFADKETYTKFNDAFANPKSLGIETEVFTYSFAEEVDANYIIVKYVFNNKTDQEISNFYAGQYWDFDMDNYDDDRVGYSLENNFGYIFDSENSPISTHIGLTLLSDGNIGFSAMNDKGKPNPIISYDGFTDEEKWSALTSGKTYTLSPANDISALISGGPYSIFANSKVEIDFLVAAGNDLDDLTNTVARARTKYLEFPTDIEGDNFLISSFNLEQNYPNPFNPSTTIRYSVPINVYNKFSNVTLKIYDILGRELTTLVNQIHGPGNYSIDWNAISHPSGIYYYQLKSNNNIETKKMLLLK